MNGNRDERQTPPPMNDEEFVHWWRSFDDNDLDEFEREIEESLKDCEIVPDPNWEEKKRRIQEMDRRAQASAYPAKMTEEQKKKFPPGLLAYWRGEAATPYDDPTAWDEFAKALTPSNDSPQSQPDLASTADDDA